MIIGILLCLAGVLLADLGRLQVADEVVQRLDAAAMARPVTSRSSLWRIPAALRMLAAQFPAAASPPAARLRYLARSEQAALWPGDVEEDLHTVCTRSASLLHVASN